MQTLSKYCTDHNYNQSTARNAAARGLITGAALDTLTGRWLVPLDCDWQPLARGGAHRRKYQTATERQTAYRNRKKIAETENKC